jgi:hypothetical protein
MIETALVTLLNGNAGVNALLGGRIRPLVTPQEMARPNLAYQRISNTRNRAHTGPSGTQNTRIQLTVQALTYESAKTVMAAIVALLECYQGTVDGIRIDRIFIENDLDGESSADQSPVARVDLLIGYHE